ncbi:hypothetical protein Q31b_46770 [Novipirellula aureliae]|uniref:DUF368 domain-containing protein n=1 Tax=Novipirellula aureliae TaxID=2527966 RepID=A0A5C6DM59_9BACT|nr:DUF368 domain-containing protein [Novipirellula aureliae]TWU37888.1 hypothetical protein Q31b_46770 [Novipirellula aureliae]
MKRFLRRDSIAAAFLNVLRGFCMGAADTVPGVSGGTVALILGHYRRLITSISRVDSRLLKLLSNGRIRESIEYVDLRFLAALGLGIATGLLSLAGLMHWLLDHKQPETFAVFFGLILGSIWIVKNYVARWAAPQLVACLAGVAAAVAISFVPAGDGGTSLPYLFLSGSVAICAMILPGISGAFVLLLFGVYHVITGLIRDAVHLQFSSEGLSQLAVFACGCLFGLLAFSRALHWLLDHHRGSTMAALIGLMLGSVSTLWPLQQATEETAALEAKFRVMEFVSPADWTGNLWLLAGLIVASALAVVFVEKVATRSGSPS